MHDSAVFISTIYCANLEDTNVGRVRCGHSQDKAVEYYMHAGCAYNWNTQSNMKKSRKMQNTQKQLHKLYTISCEGTD